MRDNRPVYVQRPISEQRMQHKRERGNIQPRVCFTCGVPVIPVLNVFHLVVELMHTWSVRTLGDLTTTTMGSISSRNHWWPPVFFLLHDKRALYSCIFFWRSTSFGLGCICCITLNPAMLLWTVLLNRENLGEVHSQVPCNWVIIFLIIPCLLIPSQDNNFAGSWS